jgi:hypothetical protein
MNILGTRGRKRLGRVSCSRNGAYTGLSLLGRSLARYRTRHADRWWLDGALIGLVDLLVAAGERREMALRCVRNKGEKHIPGHPEQEKTIFSR